MAVLTRIVRRSSGRVWYRVHESDSQMVTAAETLAADFGDDFTVSCVQLDDSPDAKPPWIKDATP
jgi:hypothetical protein